MLRAVHRRLLEVERWLYTGLSSRATRTRGTSRPRHLITGERGEDEAYFYLLAKGYTVVARRWRSGTLRGDLDLVGWDGDTLVVFEIKTRTARDFAAAEAEVDYEKQRMLRRMTRAYLRQFPERHRQAVPVRFDVIAVYLLQTGTEFEHFRSAFARDEA